MLYLHTLGSVYLSQGTAQPMGGAASQRRVLALLAILSAAGDAGVSRDRLVSILWPDADPERARHSLTQALYQARRAVECDDLFLSGTDLRLNRNRISSDVAEFEAAARVGDLDLAVTLYRGEFLSDFFLPGVPDFDQWADGQRRRLVGLAAEVLERLADRAAVIGDSRRIIEYRRRLAALDPLDSRAALLLIAALHDGGDPTGARRHLELHEALVRDELGEALDARFDTLRQTLRPIPAVAEASARLEMTSGAAGHVVTSDQSKSSPPSAPPINRRSRRAVRLGTLGAIAALGIFAFHPTRQEPAPRQFDRQLLVAPFRTSGADPSLDFLREGLVELLSIRLAGDSEAYAVDPGAVLRTLPRTPEADSTSVDAQDAMRLARRFRARSVVTGSVVGNPRRLVISASVIDRADSTRRVVASAEGPLDSLTSIVDHLSGQLLVASAGETERFRRALTPSLPALRAYLDGLAAYRAREHITAVRHLETAVRLDSTFALGALYLALASDKANASEQHDRALFIAWRNRAKLAERDRLLLTAFAGPRYPNVSTVAEQRAAWEAAITWAPGRTDAVVEYADRLMRSARLLGVPNSADRAGSLLRYTLQIDPGNRQAQSILMSLALRTGGESLRNLDSMENLPAWATWSAAVLAGDSGTVEAIRERMPNLSIADLTRIARLGQVLGMGSGDVERALHFKRLRATRQRDQFDAILAQHALALNQGRPGLALELTRQLEAAEPGWRAHLRLRVLDALYGGGDSTAGAQAATQLAERLEQALPGTATARAIWLADACVVAQWRLASRHTEGIERIVQALRTAGLPRVAVPVAANARACAELLEAELEVIQRPATALPRVAHLDSLMLSGPGARDAGVYSHIFVARLYEQLGQPDRALAAIRRRPFADGWPRYLATARRDEGRLALVVGDKQGAEDVYRKYLSLREAPEPELAGEVASIRATVAKQSSRVGKRVRSRATP